jgi:hypothetical protein
LTTSLSGDPVTTPFAIAADTCSDVSLAEGESCTISVEFHPTVAATLGTSAILRVVGGLVSAESWVTGKTDPPDAPF